jgi:hypothetical protein
MKLIERERLKQWDEFLREVKESYNRADYSGNNSQYDGEINNPISKKLPFKSTGTYFQFSFFRSFIIDKLKTLYSDSKTW